MTKFGTLEMYSDGGVETSPDESEDENVILYLTIGGNKRVWAVEATPDEAIDHAYDIIYTMLRRGCDVQYDPEFDPF